MSEVERLSELLCDQFKEIVKGNWISDLELREIKRKIENTEWNLIAEDIAERRDFRNDQTEVNGNEKSDTNPNLKWDAVMATEGE